MIAKYADDTAILINDSNLTIATKVLQSHLVPDLLNGESKLTQNQY